jgi:hypothetical protein
VQKTLPDSGRQPPPNNVDLDYQVYEGKPDATFAGITPLP